VLEPYLTEQWYLDVSTLAAKAIKAVEDGRTKFVPENWTGVYYKLAEKHPAVVYFPPIVVGPSDSGLVRAR